MTWNRKTTRRDRKRRTRRGQTARGRRARLRDLAFWSDYFRPVIRQACDDISHEFVELIANHPLEDRFYGRFWTPQPVADPFRDRILRDIWSFQPTTDSSEPKP